MKKLIALLVVSLFVIVGCADTPSTSLIERTLIKAMPKGEGDWYATSFIRDNGEAITILGVGAYRVDGKVILRPTSSLVRSPLKGEEGKFVEEGAEYLRTTSVVFVKTEKGWDPRLINGLHISYYPGFNGKD